MKMTGRCKTVFGRAALFAVPVLAGVLLAAALCACKTEAAREETGSVRITISNAEALASGSLSRQESGASYTIIPEAALTLFDYEYWFKSAGGTDPSEPLLPSYGDDTFYLEPGAYTVRVKAFIKGSGGRTLSYNAVDSANEVAVGESGQFTVVAALLKEDVDVVLSPFIGSDGEGVFSFVVSRPAGTTITTLSLTSIAGDSKIYDLVDDTVDSGTAPYVTRSGTLDNLSTGYYTFLVIIEDNEGKSAGGMEVIHIYNSLTTKITYEFVEDNFVSGPPSTLRGTVSVELSFWDTDDSSDVSLSAAVLDKSSSTMSMLTASVPAGYTFDAWYLNGQKQPNGTPGVSIDSETHIITLTSDMPLNSNYQLVLVAWKDEKAYSKMTRFSVIQSTTTIGSRFDLANEEGVGGGWAYAAPVLTIMNGANILIHGKSAAVRIVATGTSTVTLNNAAITLSGTGAVSPFSVESGANATLLLSGESAFTGAGKGAGIYVTAGGTLTIDSSESTTASPHAQSGTLTATGGWSGAGIGGNQGEDSGTITIAGGTVYAKGYSSPTRDGITHHNAGAGIGGGGRNAADGSADGGDFGTITITGGVVEATGGGEETTVGEGAAGIGGGGGKISETVTLTALGSVSISGGSVTARGGTGSAGIGGGERQTGGNIRITGGTVSATGGYAGAGIGGGNGGEGGTVDITGGTVSAAGGYAAAGIGGGKGGAGGTIRVNYPDGTGVGSATGGSSAPGGAGPGYTGNGGAFYDKNGGPKAFPTANPYILGDSGLFSLIVTFNSNGGGTPSPAAKSVIYGQSYGALPQVSRENYDLVGWFTATSGGTQVWATTTVEKNQNHTLYAHWTEKSSVVTFTSEDGYVSLKDGVSDYKTVTYGQPYGTLPGVTDFAYIPSGYTFGGWWTAVDGGTEVTAETIVTAAADHEVYVHWIPGSPPGAVQVRSITFSPSTNTLEAGKSDRFLPVVAPTDATNKTLTWSSGKTDVATVDATGRVTALKTGTALITASATDGSGVSGSYTLRVNTPTTIIIFSKAPGSGGTDTVTATLGYPMPTVTIPTREHYTFQGYWSGDTQYYNADGTSARAWDVDAPSAMLSAKWRGVLVNIRIVSGQEPDIQLDEPLAYREVYYMEPYGHIFPTNIAPEEYAREAHSRRRYFRWIVTGHWDEIDHVAADTIVTLPEYHEIHGAYIGNLPSSEWYDIYE